MNGRFQPGRSGNPGAADTKAAHSLQETARKHALEAIKTLSDITNGGTSGARVFRNFNPLLDRAYGKPPQLNTLATPATLRKAVST